VLQLRVFGEPSTLTVTADALGAVDGVRRVLVVDAAEPDVAVLWADLRPVAADEVLAELERLDIAHENFVLARIDVVAPNDRRMQAGAGEGFAWVQVLGEARANARPLARFSVLMMIAGVIASVGVIDQNPILIVGAMAVSPDLLPICAACVGLIGRRIRLVRQALVTLAVGLALAALVAGVVTGLLDRVDALPAKYNANVSFLHGLTHVDETTVLIALAAGIAAMLAFETRASAAVGVAISVTTIPASASLGVAFAVGAWSRGLDALAVLGVNVAALLLSGSATLAVQQWSARRNPVSGRQ
jgi:uncharacterized hydrophobic protein (TIGR00271 family)